MFRTPVYIYYIVILRESHLQTPSCNILLRECLAFDEFPFDLDRKRWVMRTRIFWTICPTGWGVGPRS